jgi:hypothetical protein
MLATAPPARRFFLLEVPGPWAADMPAAAHLSSATARRLRGATGELGARLVLIRRPGRHPADQTSAHNWAMVDRDAGVRWGHWRDEHDLLGLDLFAELDLVGSPAGRAGAPGGNRPLALVCTQGRHDLCCAVDGRPVVAAAATDPRVDVWECSHLGGDRFAANMLFLPSGHLFGGLSAATTTTVLDAALSSRVVLDHYRGRCGDQAIVQAALWHLMHALGEDRPDRVTVDPVGPVHDATGSLTLVAHHAGERYRLHLAWSLTQPHHLTCRAPGDSRVRIYRLVGEPARV